MSKKIASAFAALLLCLGLTSSVPAQAQLAAAIPIALTIGGVVFDVTSTPLAGLLGASFLMLGVSDTRDGDSVRIPTTTLPSSVPPPPVAPATSPTSGGLNPNDVYGARCSGSPPLCGYQEPINDCIAWAFSAVNTSYWTGCQALGANWAPTGRYYGYSTMPTSVQVTNPAASCSFGYSMNNGQCSLSDARAAVQDKNVDLNRSGTTLSQFATDADLSGNTIKGAVNANGSFNVAGINNEGNPVNISVLPQSGGGSIVTVTEQTDGVGGTQIKQSQIAVGADGIVTGVTNVSGTGSVNVNTGAQTGTITGSPAITNADGTNSTAQPNQIDFPTDYARSGEAAGAAVAINNNINNIFQPVPPPADPVVPDPTQMPDFGNTFDALKGFQLGAHSSQCPEPSFEIWDHQFTITAHCDLAAQNFPVLSGAMVVVWTLLGLFIVLRA